MRPRSRDIVRATKLEASKIRTTALNPDFVNGIAVDRRSDGLYNFKADSWPTTIAVRCVPGNAEIPCPQRMKAFAEDGSMQKLFLRWHRRGIRYRNGEIRILAWHTYRSNPTRSAALLTSFDEYSADVQSTEIYRLRVYEEHRAWIDEYFELRIDDLDPIDIWDVGIEGGPELWDWGYDLSLTPDGVLVGVYVSPGHYGVLKYGWDGEQKWFAPFFSEA